MASSVGEIGILRPVIEAVNDDDTAGTAVKLRVTRVPSAAIASGGYLFQRSKSRTGFAGRSDDDDGGFQAAGSLAQFAETDVFAIHSVSAQPADGDLYYRCRAVDNTSTPSEQSQWSNVAVFRKRSDRRIAVPTFPAQLGPNMGVLKGLVDNSAGLQDADGADGLTWYELRGAMSDAQQQIEGDLANRFSEHDMLELFIDSPPSLVQWFEYLAAAFVIPHVGYIDKAVQAEETELYLRLARQFRDQLLDGTVRPPGAPKRAPRFGRIVR